MSKINPTYSQAYSDPSWVNKTWGEINQPGGIRAHCTQVDANSLPAPVKDEFDQESASGDVSAFQGAVGYQPVKDSNLMESVPFYVLDNGSMSGDTTTLMGIDGTKIKQSAIEYGNG
jgi:hypothetical protein